MCQRWFLPDLYHVVKRLLVSETETLSNVQHVDFRARNHDADEGVISCTKALKTKDKTRKYRKLNVEHSLKQGPICGKRSHN